MSDELEQAWEGFAQAIQDVATALMQIRTPVEVFANACADVTGAAPQGSEASLRRRLPEPRTT